MFYGANLPFLIKNESFCSKNPPKSVRNIEVSAISEHLMAVEADLSAKSSFSAKTVSINPSF